MIRLIPVLTSALLIGALALTTPGVAHAGGKKAKKSKKAKGSTLAISYFDNNSGDPELDSLKKGLADMLITDLSGLPGMQIVERSRIESIIKELKLSKSKLVNQKTKVKMGKLLAAKYMLVGAYVVQGKKMRVDARLLAVKTGKVVVAHKVAGNKDDFFAMEKELAELVIDALKIQLTFKDKTKLRRNQTQSYAAFQAYAQGLDATDKGDYAKAKKLFQKALDADPNYKSAKTAGGRLDVVLDKHTEKRRGQSSKLLGKLDPKSKTFATDFSMLVLRLDDSDPAQYKSKLDLILHLLKTNQLPFTKTNMGLTSPLVDSVLRLMSFYMSHPKSWPLIFGTCEWAIKTAPGSYTAGSICKSYRLQIETLKKTNSAAGMEKDWPVTKKKRMAMNLMKGQYQYESLGRSILKWCAKRAKK